MMPAAKAAIPSSDNIQPELLLKDQVDNKKSHTHTQA